MIDEVRKRIEAREKLCNDQALKFNQEIAILVTAHNSQAMFMKACLESLKPLDRWILVTYDNPMGIPKRLPTQEVFLLMDQFFMKHFTNIPGPTYPQFWNFKHGVDILSGSNCTHIFVIGADCIIEKPQNLPKIVELLGNGDIIACSSKNERHGGPFCGTKSFLAKKSAFKSMMDFIEKGFVPLDHQFGNLERRFGLAVQELKINEVRIPVMPNDDQFAYGYDEDDNSINRGTWGEILGFRHLGGEHKIRRLQHRKPIEEKYFDRTFFRRQELDTIVKYWATGDKKHLGTWWKS